MPSRIKINLLPPELKDDKKRETQKAWVIRASVLLLLGMVVGTSALLAFVLIQNSRISSENRALEVIGNNISKYKEQEAIALILRSRLDGVKAITTSEYPQPESYNLIRALTPPDVRILSFSVDRTNKITLSAETNSVSSLDAFFNNLTDPKNNEGKISLVTVGSLTRNKDSQIKFDLTITLPATLVVGNKPALAPVAK